MLIINKVFFIILLNSLDQIFCISELKSGPSGILWRNKRIYHRNQNKLPKRRCTKPEGKTFYKTAIDQKKHEIMNLDTPELLKTIKKEKHNNEDNIIRGAINKKQNMIDFLKYKLKKKTKNLRRLSPNKPKGNYFKNIRKPKSTLSIERYPFMSSIQIFDECSCAGAIIQRNVIIAAASCLKKFNSKTKSLKDIKVRVGSDFCDKYGQLETVHKIHFHPLYDPWTLINNLALIQVNRDLLSKPNNKIKMIVTDYNSNLLNNKGVIIITLMGWGAKKKQSKSNAVAKRLTKTVQTLSDIKNCHQIYKRVTDKNFCANCVSQQDNCNKDIGNPALAKGRLAGIVSFGPRTCDVTSPPTVFSKLSSHKFWIDTMISLAVADLTGEVGQSLLRQSLMTETNKIKKISKLKDLNKRYSQKTLIVNKNTKKIINKSKSQNMRTRNKNEKNEKDDKFYKKYPKIVLYTFFQSQISAFKRITKTTIDTSTTQNIIIPNKNEKMEKDDKFYKMTSDASFQSPKNNNQYIIIRNLVQTNVEHGEKQKKGEEQQSKKRLRSIESGLYSFPQNVQQNSVCESYEEFVAPYQKLTTKLPTRPLLNTIGRIRQIDTQEMGFYAVSKSFDTSDLYGFGSNDNMYYGNSQELKNKG